MNIYPRLTAESSGVIGNVGSPGDPAPVGPEGQRGPLPGAGTWPVSTPASKSFLALLIATLVGGFVINFLWTNGYKKASWGLFAVLILGVMAANRDAATKLLEGRF